MRASHINYAKIKLERYIARIWKGDLKKAPFEQAGTVLLNLVFAYVRKENNIHLRWNNAEANYLALLTIAELKKRKGKDLVLIGIYDALMELAGQNKKVVDQLLLTAEIRLNELHEVQTTRGNIPKKPSPFAKIIGDIVLSNNGINTTDLIDELAKDKYSKVVRSVDSEAKKVYLENGKEKSFSAIDTSLRRAKNKYK